MKPVISKTCGLLALSLFCFTTPAPAEIIWDQPGASTVKKPNSNFYRSTNNFEGGLTLGAADVRTLQKELSRQGFYKGSIDGKWGGQTSQAILDYQSVHEMPLTGKLSAVELQQFGIVVPD